MSEAASLYTRGMTPHHSRSLHPPEHDHYVHLARTLVDSEMQRYYLSLAQRTTHI